MNETPMMPGYYWAQWRIASEGTHEANELTPSDDWIIVEVWGNTCNWMNDPSEDEAFAVSVPGVRESQWRDCFFWGEFVATLGNVQPKRGRT